MKELNFTLTVYPSSHSKPKSERGENDHPLYTMECKTADGRYYSQTTSIGLMTGYLSDLVNILTKDTMPWQESDSTQAQLEELKKQIDEFHSQFGNEKHLCKEGG